MTVTDTPLAAKIEEARKNYFRYLYLLMRGNNHNGQSYKFLFTILFRIEFYSSVDRDQNRVEDAKNMRKGWIVDENELNTERIPLDALDGPVSLLEVLIALAIRMESDIMQDDSEGDRSTLWFWTMLKNAGLEPFSDGDMSEDAEAKIYAIVTRVLDREYEVDGRGGFWPVVFSRADQRKVELWYQMGAWVNENYGGLSGV